MTEKRKLSFPAVGGSSLLVIFAVLCLTVFALLTLSTVQANGRLSDRSAQAVLDYYQADTQAERILAQLRQGTVPQGVTDEGGGRYSYTCAISDTQALDVQVQISGSEYAVLRWQAVSITDWEADDSLAVWDGQ